MPLNKYYRQKKIQQKKLVAEIKNILLDSTVARPSLQRQCKWCWQPEHAKDCRKLDYWFRKLNALCEESIHGKHVYVDEVDLYAILFGFKNVVLTELDNSRPKFFRTTRFKQAQLLKEKMKHDY